jgi:hypothetical protein
MGRIVREAIEIEIRHCNINTEGVFCVSKSWKLLIGSLKTLGTLPKPTWLRSPHITLSPCSV